MAKPLISFTIIGRNEHRHLVELLPALRKISDDVIYVDCDSLDESLRFAESLGCRVFKRPNHLNLNVNKAYAVEQARGDWVFYMDPDERLSDSLAQEIPERIKGAERGVAAFKIPRKNYFLGRWLARGGQYPDLQLRLFRRGSAFFPMKHVHEKLAVSGGVETLQESMEHHPYQDLAQMLRKLEFYSRLEADHRFQNGERAAGFSNLKFLVLKPISRFFRRYFLKGGFLDGLPGFAAAFFDGVGLVCQQLMLAELSKNANVKKVI